MRTPDASAGGAAAGDAVGVVDPQLSTEAMPAGRARPRQRLFYGWVVVGATTLVSIATCGFAGMNAGLFIHPMGDEVGVTRGAFGWAVAARQVGGAVVSPLSGRLVDRRGGRPGLLAGGALAAIALLWLSAVNSTWATIAAFGLIGMSGIIGPGAVAVTTPVLKWFEVDRTRAVAWMSLGIPIGTVIFVPVTQRLIDTYGWRTTWQILAVMCLVVVLPAAALVRRRPEDYGQWPDGREPVARLDRSESSAAARVPVAAARSFTAAEARRTSAFWRLVLVFGLAQTANASVALHRVPHWMDQGIDPTLVSWAMSLDAACAGVGTVLAGLVARRATPRTVGACSFVQLAFAVFLTIVSSGTVMMFVSMSMFGLGIGFLMLLQNYVWVEYFGREHVGQVRGSAMPVTLLCSAAGPVIAGLVFDATGTYSYVWWVGIVVMLSGAVLLLTTPHPEAPRELAT